MPPTTRSLWPSRGWVRVGCAVCPPPTLQQRACSAHSRARSLIPCGKVCHACVGGVPPPSAPACSDAQPQCALHLTHACLSHHAPFPCLPTPGAPLRTIALATPPTCRLPAHPQATASRSCCALGRLTSCASCCPTDWCVAAVRRLGHCVVRACHSAACYAARAAVAGCVLQLPHPPWCALPSARADCCLSLACMPDAAWNLIWRSAGGLAVGLGVQARLSAARPPVPAHRSPPPTPQTPPPAPPAPTP